MNNRGTGDNVLVMKSSRPGKASFSCNRLGYRFISEKDVDLALNWRSFVNAYRGGKKRHDQT